MTRTERGLWAVADGMGGHEAGDVASSKIAEALQQLPIVYDIDELVDAATAALKAINHELILIARGDGLPRTIGSTVVALAVAGPLVALPLSFLGGVGPTTLTLLPPALGRSVLLGVGVAAGTLVLGGALAVLVSFWDFPGRRLLDRCRHGLLPRPWGAPDRPDGCLEQPVHHRGRAPLSARHRASVDRGSGEPAVVHTFGALSAGPA